MANTERTGASRRGFLKQAALGGAAAIAGFTSDANAGGRKQAVGNLSDNAYKHRIGFGAWINDMRNQPLPLQNWPAPQFDDATVEGAVRAMDVMSEAGYQYLDAFGLWSTNDYPVDIISAFQDKERHKRLERLFREARKRNLGMMLPLGLFTWGYDRIIQEDPEVRGKDQDGNPHAHAMCGAKERAWEYVEKLIQTAMGQFDFAGVHMESADLGWCMCPECGGRYGTVGYNCRLNIRAADFIKERWPDALVYTIPINWLPWRLSEEGIQQRFSREEFEHVLELSKHIDVFMDQGHRGCYTPPEWIPELHCDYGTSGGLWLYHCVRMHRLSYLVPYPKRACEFIKRHYDLGARACLYYQGPMINPAVEINTAVSGRVLSDVTRDPGAIIEEVITKYYKPRTAEAGKTLASVYARVEDGLFGRWDPAAIKEAHKVDVPGEFSGWGLFGEEPEMPGHMFEPFLDKAGRIAYKDELIGALRDIEAIKAEVGDTERTARLIDALTLTVQFLKAYIAFKG